MKTVTGSNNGETIASLGISDLDWAKLLQALIGPSTSGSAALAGSEPFAFGDAELSGLNAATVGATSGELFPSAGASQHQLAPVTLRQADLPADAAMELIWADILGRAMVPPSDLVSDEGLLSGPGYRIHGAFLFFDENGGGIDGSEMLFAEIRPANDYMYEIIFF